jgi:DNA-binding NtrC family response regulator
VSDPRDTLVEHVSTGARRDRAQRAPGRLCLVVIGEGLDATYPLPDRGKVSIGRSDAVDVRIDHRSVSREHALLTIDRGLTIEDLGSANGTRVRDARLEPRRPREVSLGEPIDLGSVMVVVQQRAAPVSQRHIWAHGYFETRLEEECARAEQSDGRFAVLRLHGGATDAALERALGATLRPMDVIGYYGPDEYEVLVVDSDDDVIAELTAGIDAAFARAGVDVRIGVARYPDDARDPYTLLRKASVAALGQRPAAERSGTIVVADAAMQHFDRIVQRIAAGTISVLVSGETGVGKEVLAELLHKLSPRAARPFLRLNCAALTESLLESELFGHERGAFTGAAQAKPGLLETADGGTVFLDEIGELPMSIQVKLLRVLEERKVLRVGGLAPRAIDVRFLAATNRDLEHEVAQGRFRQDLYFRLNGVALTIPPLRARLGELPALAVGFLRDAAERAGQAEPPAISPAALQLLREYPWPGNIRELRNVMERAALLCTGRTITLEHLPVEKMRDPRRAPVRTAPARHAEPPPLPPPEPARRGRADAEEEKQRILDALAQAGGNQTDAARLLGMSRRTLINRVIAYNLPRPRKK